MTYRVWYRNRSARIVSAQSVAVARQVGREEAKKDAADLLQGAAACADLGQLDRAKELRAEYRGCTYVTRVERLN